MVLLQLFDYLIVPTIQFARFCRGFHAKNVSIDEFEWHYIEREGCAPNETEPVIFVHGFSSWKESWLNVASRVDKKYKVVIPDLPGHGKTEPADPLMSYTIKEQTERLSKFIDKTIPAGQKVHVVGCSMGGLIAGMYSAMYPDRVRSVTLICPAGLTMPKKSDAYHVLENEGKNLLMAHTTDDVIEMNQYLGFKPLNIPRMIASTIAQHRKRTISVVQRIFDDMSTEPTLLEEYLHLIQAKTLVMWGKNDRILDFSSFPIIQEKLSNASKKYTIAFDECGHTVQHERYQECANAINAMISGNEPTAVMKK
ncbi:hypothetical protein Poli38472_006445 [Pythium oligandrum]|uniref:AB hydrolase-1 domain-containing protein n=1 Tax=Pythium oligandrum TaxID=41045 RepID=A0A8K1C4X1_PYTOL|nr:hypothetical protein Poli38472_006445 [Pythium oligandrum]|eukprot:TMW56435.1 hypothetical protein Poli38472_006445 [Pythium oligandrum]